MQKKAKSSRARICTIVITVDVEAPPKSRKSKMGKPVYGLLKKAKKRRGFACTYFFFLSLCTFFLLSARECQQNCNYFPVPINY